MHGRILIVEDEPDLAEPLVFALESDGHHVTVVTDGEAGVVEVFSDDPPDVVLLDLMLPRLSGLEVCRRIRSDPRTAWLPVVLVTARADEYDKVLGFEAGADDYITKPFSLREVRLRVQALLRRTTERASSVERKAVRSGRLLVDEQRHVAELDGQELDLTVVEFRLLSCFVRHPLRAMTRDVIRELTWGDAYAITERAVDTNVRRLRMRLGDIGDCVETVRGIGYRWAPPEGP